MKTTPTPEQLGIKPEHITEVVRNPRAFSVTVHELASDIPTMRLCRDALIEGIKLVKIFAIANAQDQETVLKRIDGVCDETISANGKVY